MIPCLIVDDSAVIRRIIRQTIDEFGFDFKEAENGQVALSMCKETLPKLIMLDWNMPIMTGIEFLCELRALENGKDPIVIFCTTENDMSFIQKALEAGANDFIMKPFDKEILHMKLENNNFMKAQ